MEYRKKLQLVTNALAQEYELLFDQPLTGTHAKHGPWWKFGLKGEDGVEYDWFASNERVAEQLQGFRKGSRVRLYKKQEVGQDHPMVVVEGASGLPAPPPAPQPAPVPTAGSGEGDVRVRLREQPEEWGPAYAECILRAANAVASAAMQAARDEGLREFVPAITAISLREVASMFFIELLRQ